MKAKIFILSIGLVFAALVGRAQEFSCGAKAPEFGIRSVAQSSAGVRRILWYRITFAGDSRLPATQEQADAALQSANAILQRISYGKVSLTWTVTPLLELPQTTSYYAANFYTSFLTDARAAAVKAGFNPADFDHDLLAPPPFSGFPSGLAGVGGRWVYLSVPHGGLVVHELGHNFGLLHANSRVTPAPATNVKDWPPFPSNVTEITGVFAYEHNSLVGRAGVMFAGRSAEYGDLFDIMGPAEPTGDINLDYKKRLGWIGDNSITNVVGSGVYRIYTPAAPALQAGRHYAIRIDRPAVGHQEDQSSKYYWIQMDDTETGVLLRWSDGSGPSLLVNSAAAYFPSFDRAALPIGRAFDDPHLALTIKPVASGGNGVEHWIDVSIDFNAGDEEKDNPPLLPEMPGAYQIKGRVVDENNQPIAKCRVHNGRMNSVVGDRSDFVSTQTDRDGNYTLWVDDPGPFTVGVSAYGYTAAPGASERVVSIPSPGITNANFSLRTLPRVTVTAVPQISKGDTAIFAIHRTGPTDEPLQVDWQRTGTVHGLDSPGVAQRGTVLILSGQSSTTVSMPTVFDNLAEAPETLTLHAITPGALDRDGILFSYPGWELRGEGADEKWYQTDPAFATYADASATVTIVNSQSATLQLVLNTGSLATLQIVGPANGKIRIDTSADLITWQPVATNQLGASGATVALPTQSPADSRFYRAQKVE